MPNLVVHYELRIKKRRTALIKAPCGSLKNS